MFVTRSINADHKDLIHDVAYDFYGQRMATCSSDQSVKVWDLGPDNQWHCTANWKTHSGSVWKVTWAHPEFGQVIATCSFDRSASVWEEMPKPVVDGAERGQTSHWVKRTNLVDSRTSVADVRFAPRHLGLLLATCSSEGIVRFYEAPDVMNISQWTLQHETNIKQSCSCLAWNPSRIHPPMIAIGSDDNTPGNNEGKVLIYEYSESQRRWNKVETLKTFTDPIHDLAFAPNLGRSYHLLAVASKDLGIVVLRPIMETAGSIQSASSRFEMRQVGQFEDHGSVVWRVSWNITGTILSSSGDDGNVRLWKANYQDVWKCIAVIKGSNATNVPMDQTYFSQPSGSSGKH